MAGVMLHASSTEIALAASATSKTFIQLVTAANHRVRIQGWGVAIKGTSATDPPVLCTVMTQSTAGTTTGAATPTISKKNSSDQETLQSSAVGGPTTGSWTTSEPTAGTTIENFEVHPQTGYRVFYPMGQEIIISATATVGRMGFKALSSTLTYSTVFEIDLEE